MNVIEILNTIRDNNSAMYNERVPEATRTNLEQVGNAVMSTQATQNEFLNALVNRIAFTIVSNRRFENPLSILKKAGKPFGTDIEEIYTNPVSAVTYDGSNTSDMLKVSKPDVKTIFHKMNRQDKYPVSISNAQLSLAFTSEFEMEKLITSIINAMYSGDEMDEFLLMKNTISDAIANKKLKAISMNYDGGADTSTNLVKVLKTLSLDFTFPSKEYNGYNEMNSAKISAKSLTPCITWTPKENQVLLIRSDVDASTDVEVLAKAFNMDKTNFLERKFVVPDFGDSETLAVICDESIFQVRDVEYCVRSFDNGSNLVTNYWLHHWQIISLSLFGNAVAIQNENAGA